MAAKTIRTSAKAARRPASKTAKTKPKRLAGGNPQLAKDLGDAPVQAWIAALPG